MRPLSFELDYTKWAEGSVLCAFGDTKVLCNASVEERVPGWMNDSGRGWVTAEYAMLPRSTDRRNRRESLQGRVGGRTQEISRLVGRSLRAAVDMEALGERTITLDCDVIQADGGTRTASITGGWVALALAIKRLQSKGLVRKDPIRRAVAAVSLGLRGDELLVDLDFEEDVAVDTDLNLVMTEDEGIVEIQGTAEKAAFGRNQLDAIMDAGERTLREVMHQQRSCVDGAK
ncbi:MAG: ribonuclease PH [Myxococcota bacterium]